MKLTAFLALLLVAGIAVLGRRLIRDGWSADEHYRRAERWYQAGDFEKAELACQKALQRDPRHAPARALFMEVQFILGKGRTIPYDGRYDRFFVSPAVSNLQTLVEIDNAYARGVREVELDPEAARREFRKILEFCKWLPVGVEVEARRRQAQEMLDVLETGR